MASKAYIMKKMLSLLAATLLAINPPTASADPVGDISEAWQKLEEIQMVAALDRAVTIYAFYDLEQKKLNLTDPKQDTQQQDIMALNHAMPRAMAYLQDKVSECYMRSVQSKPELKHGINLLQAKDCAPYDLLLHDHLRSDYVKQQENGATYPFSYTLHPQTQQWQKQYAQEAQALLHNVPEARGLLKQSLQTFPFVIMFPGMALQLQKSIAKQP